MNRHERRYQILRTLVDTKLRSLVRQKSPREVTEACRYVLDAGGKRIRSTLVMLSCEAVGGTARQALNAAAAVEVMHNFTLVHDDIMDHAASRRGRPTVHVKWDTNNALLAGDVLIGLAYQQVLKSPSRRLQRILEVFTDGLLEVCEGQALDLEYEQRSDVTLDEYFDMIEKKTGRLLAAATEIGALIGGGSHKQVLALRRFGHYLGRAFQLQDDVLDVVAEEKEFGKTIGGDILEGKKTFLLLKSLETATDDQRMHLMKVMNRKRSTHVPDASEREEEVERITRIYNDTGALNAARVRIHRDTQRAEAMLHALPSTTARDTLLWLSQMLLKRNS